MFNLDKLKELLRKYFERSDELEDTLSVHWRAHANRRTTFILLAAGSTALLLYMYAIQPPGNFPVDKLITVPEGPLSEVAHVLKEGGVIRSELAFQAFVVAFGHERSARAGDYLFKEPRDVIRVARAISRGLFGLEPVRIRITEGATTREMAIIYRSQLERFNEQSFLSRAGEEEGYLFPDTYFFLPNATEDTVLDTMRQNFDNRIAGLAEDIAASDRSFEDIIKMASIIEREARDPDDRRMISGVLWNRIDKKMLLQVDAVFLYSIGKSTFQLTLADLASDSPYNTYKYKGLPPTPIGSPSLDSIEAAIHPTKNSYLFYLADSHGTTYYSKTYQEHLRKKRLYLGT